jgi:hypothetical protein
MIASLPNVLSPSFGRMSTSTGGSAQRFGGAQCHAGQWNLPCRFQGGETMVGKHGLAKNDTQRASNAMNISNHRVARAERGQSLVLLFGVFGFSRPVTCCARRDRMHKDVGYKCGAPATASDISIAYGSCREHTRCDFGVKAYIGLKDARYGKPIQMSTSQRGIGRVCSGKTPEASIFTTPGHPKSAGFLVGVCPEHLWLPTHGLALNACSDACLPLNVLRRSGDATPHSDDYNKGFAENLYFDRLSQNKAPQMGQPQPKCDLLKTRSFGDPNCCTEGTFGSLHESPTMCSHRSPSLSITVAGPGPFQQQHSAWVDGRAGGAGWLLAVLCSHVAPHVLELVACVQCAPPALFTADERQNLSTQGPRASSK